MTCRSDPTVMTCRPVPGTEMVRVGSTLPGAKVVCSPGAARGARSIQAS
jgi:hypothetical protein